MPTAINLRFRPGRSDTGPGAALLAAFAAEMGTLYVPRFEAGSPSATPAELAPPGGAFLVGYLDSRAGRLRRPQAPRTPGGRGVIGDLISAPVVCVTARPVGHGDGPRGG